MSSSRRAEVVVVAGALALVGCMKIYPDPELPDIEARWYEGDCREGTGDVTLALIGIDTPTFRADLRVPCADTKATFVDLPRERYRIEGALLTSEGEVFSEYREDLDLRNGFDERADMYFASFDNLRVAWTFDMGASCASLAADSVAIELATEAFPEPFSATTACDLSPFLISVPDGIYTITARALAGTTTVAVSPPATDVAIDFESFAVVNLVLSPCGAACP